MHKYLIIFFLFVCLTNSQGQTAPEVVYTTGHTTQINAMTVTSNNKFLASAGNNKLIKIWDIASGREYRTLTGTDGRVIDLFFSSDNFTLIGISANQEMIGWNIITGEKLFETTSSGNFKLGATFKKNGKDIIYATPDNQLAHFNIETKAVKVFDEDFYCNGLVVDKKQNKIYAVNHLGDIKVYDLNSYQTLSEFKVGGKPANPIMRPLITPNGNFMINVLVDNSLRLIDLNTEKVVIESSAFKSPINAFEIDPQKPYVYCSFHSGEVVIYDYRANKIIDNFNEREVYGVNGMTTYPDGDVLILSYFDLIRFYNVRSKQFFKRLSPKVSVIDNMAYDQNGVYLAAARTQKGKIEIWDLRLNKVVKEIYGIFPCEFTPDSKKLVFGTGAAFVEYDTETWEMTGKYDTKGQLFQQIAFSKDGEYLAMAGFSDEIRLYKTETKKQYKSLRGHVNVTSLDFHPTKPLLASSAYDAATKIWNFEQGKLLHTFKDQTIVVSGTKFSPDGSVLVSTAWDKTICVYNPSNYTLIKKWSGHHGNIAGLDFNKTGEVFVTYATNQGTYEADNSVIFWDLKGNQIHQEESHTSGIKKALFDKKADYVFSASDDGSIKITDYKKKKVLATYIAVGGDEFVIYTPENYYMASKKALSAIAFRIGTNLVPFEQFDINLNRPDLIAKAIGKSPEQLIRAYEYLYKKRLRKFNLEEGSLKIDFNLPTTEIENEVPLVTSASEIEISIKSQDEKYTINQINIYVNDTPIYGEQGFRPASKVNSHRKVVKVPIIEGVNKIQVSCINSNGTESLYDTKEVIKEATTNKNDFYFVAIGVSNYKDNRFNLTYPTKDAKDMVAKLSGASSLYNKIYTKTLLNEEVNSENISALTDFFANCKPDDVAAIFIAGHGLLDENFDYFFATYDVDFGNPSVNGLPYQDIHALLNAIKAYRKLLIMDTCHSGELDKEEVESSGKVVEVEEGDIQFRAAGYSVQLKEAFGFENALELTQDLFSDTRKGSGATVISSAGGAEYAMESDEWKNGLFTYAFLSGLSGAAADLNKDGQIQISEIRSYVNAEVAKLSGGKQVPSSREENISADFPIYRK